MMRGRGPRPPALRHRDFRVFVIGQAISLVGTQFTNVAMAWQIYELTGSPLQIGLLGLARGIPQIALTLLGGMLADAVDRRRLMMAMQLAQFCVSASLVALTAAELIEPFMLYVASALLAVFAGLENPTRASYVPNLVPRADLTSAIAFTTSMRQVAYILGPSLAGVVLGFAGVVWCYTVDATSWVLMLSSLALIRGRQAASGRRGVSFAALAEGIAFVRSQRIILLLMVLDFSANFFGSPRALLPVYAKDIFHVGPEGLGLLYAASSIGALGGAFVMSTIGQPQRAGRWVLTGVVFYSVCAMGFALSPVYWVALILLVGMGVGDTVSSVLRGSINQLVTPDRLRGRVSAVNSVFINGGPPLGQFESGAVAALWGVPASAFTGGLATLLVALSIAAIPAARRFTLPREEAQPMPA
ncbi:MAG: hypothetical protein QOF51_4223 [Chloroflexota bacterium]|jgi:MFS family permease|nr:hypothetical protein [Chloroflexota bacterium]